MFNLRAWSNNVAYYRTEAAGLKLQIPEIEFTFFPNRENARVNKFGFDFSLPGVRVRLLLSRLSTAAPYGAGSWSSWGELMSEAVASSIFDAQTRQ